MFPSRPVAIPDDYARDIMRRDRRAGPPELTPGWASTQPVDFSAPDGMSRVAQPVGGERWRGTPEDGAWMTTGTPINLQQNPMPMQTTSAPQMSVTQAPAQQLTSPQQMGPHHPQMQYQPGQYSGQFMNQALQMAGFPGPAQSGLRPNSQMAVTPYSPGGGGASSGGLDGSPQPPTPFTPDEPLEFWRGNPEYVPVPGGSQQDWFNDFVRQTGGQGGSFDLNSTGGSASIGSALSGAGNLLNALVNPIGAIVGAVTGEDEEEAAPDENRTPDYSGNPYFGQFGPVPGVPGVVPGNDVRGAEGPRGAVNIGGVQPGNIDHLLRQINPYFGTR